MKKILYMSHVSWGWIKQRPQFIAEELSKKYMLDYYYSKSNRYNYANRNFKKDSLSVKGYRSWPFERISFLPMKWSDGIKKLIFNSYNINYNQYDIIWVTSPNSYSLVKEKIGGKTLVYDCMDDMLEFPYIKRYPKLLSHVFKCEEELIKDADIVICSAESLKNKLISRYNINREYHIVNNAISDAITEYSIDGESLPKNTIVYIGTISEWFDFGTIISALEKHSELNVFLYGPIRMQNPPNHERLFYKGSIKHNEILGIMNNAAGLIMPFVVNELIESVNPVKLYEYVYSGKPICASRYGETVKFEKYVSLYGSEQEFENFVSKLLRGEIVVDEVKMRDYALANTWRNRAEQIFNLLEIKK